MFSMKNLTKIKGDIFGGITAGVISLPMALGFGAASGIGAAAGLYTAIILTLMASVFGSTKTQISGPTGPMVVLVAAIAATYMDNIAIVFVITALAGIFQIILGITKMGRFIRLVPPSAISGFISGIGIIVIVTQLPPLLGLASQGNVVNSLRYMMYLPPINFYSLFVGALAFSIVFFSPKQLGKIIPFSLLALIIGTLVAVLAGFSVPQLGLIPSGLPQISLAPISMDKFIYILPVAFGLALLSSIDTLLTSRAVDKVLGTKHNSNKDLVGIGLGNALAGVFGGFAGSNSTVPTMTNIKFGATGRLSGVITACLLLLTLFVLAPVASKIPMAVLSGILIKIGLDVIDWRFIRRVGQNLRVLAKKLDLMTDAAVMGTVFMITIFWNLIVAVGVGVVLHYAIRTVRYFNALRIRHDKHYIAHKQTGE